MKLHQATFGFLKSINEHNTRDFFALVRPLYDEIRENTKAFCDELIIKMSEYDIDLKNTSSKESMFRIYRDARRLKPGDQIYKKNFSFAISSEGKKASKAKYYIHIEPGFSFFGGGVYFLEATELRNLRYFLSENGDKYRSIINDKKFVKTFAKVSGEKTNPRMKKGTGNLDLVAYKQHMINKKYSDEEVLAEDFMDKIMENFLVSKPFMDFLNEGIEYTARENSKNPKKQTRKELLMDMGFDDLL